MMTEPCKTTAENNYEINTEKEIKNGKKKIKRSVVDSDSTSQKSIWFEKHFDILV